MIDIFNTASLPIQRFAAAFITTIAATPHDLIRLGRALAGSADFFEDAALLTSYGDHRQAAEVLATCRRFVQEALAVLDAFPASPSAIWQEGAA